MRVLCALGEFFGRKSARIESACGRKSVKVADTDNLSALVTREY
jgi:hypothetical protein